MRIFEKFVVFLGIVLIGYVFISAAQGTSYEEAAYAAFTHAYGRMSAVDPSDDVALKQACGKDENQELACNIRTTGEGEKFMDLTFQSDRMPLWLREHREIVASAQVRLKPYVDKFYLVKK